MPKSKICLFWVAVFLSQVSQEVKAQIVPDNTLGAESSVINSIDELRNRIQGGAIRGSNLFHSFQDFNIGEGLEVYFANPEGIVNIFSRVTGSNISEILGTLGVEGDANLFFINPNGLFFGENASLDLGGSFIATTANSVKFADGTSFAARGWENKKPILTWNAPIGLGLDNNSGIINARGTGHQLTLADPDLFFSPILGGASSPNGLTATPNRTLALIGGQVNIDGGVLTSPSGNIEVAGVEQGNVKLNLNREDISFDYSEVEVFGDIRLDNYALLDASGFLDSSKNFASGGIINLHGKNLQINNGSLIFISNLGEAPFSSININATNSVIFRGVSSPGSFEQGRQEITRGISTNNFSSTQGGNISLIAKNLTLQDFSAIGTSSFATGQGGNVDIIVQDSLEILGAPPIPFLFLPSSIATLSLESGNAGDIKISGNFLSIQDGGSIISQGFFTGNSGNIALNFSVGIEIVGGFLFDSNFGDGIEPNNLATSVLGTSASNLSQAGNVFIETGQLKLTEGGRVNSTAFVLGKAGNININATDSVEVQGQFENFDSNSTSARSQIISSAEKIAPGVAELLNIPDTLQAQSGSIVINTNQLQVQNEGLISVINQGTGDAGDIEINGSNISLNNQGEIGAFTLSGQGGNITLVTNQLQLQNNSSISASAGGEGNGGNIDITADTIVALNDSDITATAFKGNGGNITITADGILGIEERKATPGNGTSDIDASSEFGEDGTVVITNPQTVIQDPIIAVREISSNKQEPNFQGTCVDGVRILADYRHPDFSQKPDDFTDNTQHFPTDDFAPSEKSMEHNSIEDLIWSEGDPIVPADQIVVTEDGRWFLVVQSQFESLQKNGCVATEEKKATVKTP